MLGHLIRLQARSALADFAGADRHAAEADRLAGRHELPLARVFTQWYRAMRLAETDRASVAETAYRDAAARLDGAGMPGLERGLLFEALWCLTARAAIGVGDRETMRRAHRALAPAAAELAGAGSGLLTLGPVSRHLADLTTALR